MDFSADSTASTVDCDAPFWTSKVALGRCIKTDAFDSGMAGCSSSFRNVAGCSFATGSGEDNDSIISSLSFFSSL